MKKFYKEVSFFMGESERTIAMKKGFMALYEKGYSIPEIAERYNLSFSTVYKRLEEIAQENGVEGGREALLQLPRTQKNERKQRRYEEKEHVDGDSMLAGFAELSESLEKMMAEIDETLGKGE
jgi:transposase